MTGLTILVLLIGALILVKKRRREYFTPPPPMGALLQSVSPALQPAPSGAQSPPPRKSGQPAGYWLRKGQEIRIAGIVVESGMLYYGRGLSSVASQYDPEPSLIDPTLKLAKTSVAFADVEMPYWPAYSTITPAARREYLDWIAGGKKDPNANIGFVFLYFYGLERRALTDSRSSEEARGELTEIASEVERLLAIYGNNGSLHGYATSFLTTLELMVGAGEPDLPAGYDRCFEVPFAVKLKLGRHAADGTPVPASLALAWAETHPAVYLRTPAQRCKDEYRQLFSLYYSDRYGDGMLLRRARKKLKFEYRPASPSYRSCIEIDVGDVPDVSTLSRPIENLKSLSDEVEAALDAYSRYLGRRPEERRSLPALALLPAELTTNQTSPTWVALRDWAEGELADKTEAVVSATNLLRHWPFDDASSPKKRELSAYAQLLGKLGVGFEPDCRFVSIKLAPDDQAVLFRLSQQSAAPSAKYAALTTVMQLAAAVVVADGTVSEAEERHLEQHLAEAMGINEAERRRLSAHLTWLLINPSRLAMSKKRIEALRTEDRAHAAALLVNLAGADGRVDKQEVRLLEKVYIYLGLPRDQLYSDLHSADPTDAPIVVESPSPRTDYAIPSQSRSSGSALDMSRVEKTLAETKSLQVMLGQIFSDEEDSLIEPAEASTISTIAGLDAAHADLLRRLLEQREWTSADFDSLCEDRGLMPSGAIEILNELSFEKAEALLLDGEDLISVDHEVAREIMI